jgi:hypothetical protein
VLVLDFIFTIDYEIYGNGTGSLQELVYEPARRLKELFQNHDARFVNFVEVAEFEKIEAYGTDAAIDLVKKQIQEFYRDGFEIALHLHPQWANARYEQGRWALDLDEYNLCKLSTTRIAEIVDASLAYLRHVTRQHDFTPISFRAGNWLFQPTQTAAAVLAEKGIRIDSSVFKGGLQHNHKLDYRPAARNGYFWPFRCDVNQPDPAGPWIEVPIHTDMVPFWKMPTSKRMAFTNQFGVAGRNTRQKVGRALDFLRFFYPLKLDFCRMTLQELTSMIARVIREDREQPEVYRPLVAIGHTKDLADFDTIDSLLSFLKTNGIPVSTFADVYPKLAKLASKN